MTIVSRGYTGSPSSNNEEEFLLFTENLELIRAHEKTILECAEYFFCDIPFASCSWPYIGGDGPLCLGYLLLGWRDGLLIEPCPGCGGECLVTSFAGSPLSGSNSWSGFCSNCKKKYSKGQSIHKPFYKKLGLITDLRKQYPQRVTRLEEFDSQKFSFAGDGLEPAKKTRPVTIELFQPVPLSVLIQELKEGVVRPKNSPMTGLEGDSIGIKLSPR